jgi:hypothetical protein
MVRFDLKKGTTLSLAFAVSEEGVAVTVTSWTVACTLSDRYGLFSFAPTVNLSSDTITLSATAVQTATFPVGILKGRLTITIAGVTHASESFELEVAS